MTSKVEAASIREQLRLRTTTLIGGGKKYEVHTVIHGNSNPARWIRITKDDYNWYLDHFKRKFNLTIPEEFVDEESANRSV